VRGILFELDLASSPSIAAVATPPLGEEREKGEENRFKPAFEIYRKK
jgi:hypothetical protein